MERNNIFKQFKGALTEQYVLQQLITDCGIEPFYWSAERAQAEIDFLIQTEEGKTIPIEVKAERNLRAKSLHSFCRRFGNPVAVRTSMSAYEVNDISIPGGENAPEGHYTLIDIPLYALSVLKEILAEYVHK